MGASILQKEMPAVEKVREKSRGHGQGRDDRSAPNRTSAQIQSMAYCCAAEGIRKIQTGRKQPRSTAHYEAGQKPVPGRPHYLALPNRVAQHASAGTESNSG